MLELTTEKPSIELKIDGQKRKLPIFLDLAEMKEMARIHDDAPGAAAFAEWFVGFAASHLGDEVRDLGDVQITALMDAWGKAREKAGEPDPGKR